MKNSAIRSTIDQGMAWPPPGLLALWWRRHVTRQQLKLMLQQDPDRLYGDLGLTEDALRQECRKWFWEQ